MLCRIKGVSHQAWLLASFCNCPYLNLLFIWFLWILLTKGAPCNGQRFLSWPSYWLVSWGLVCWAEDWTDKGVDIDSHTPCQVVKSRRAGGTLMVRGVVNTHKSLQQDKVWQNLFDPIFRWQRNLQKWGPQDTRKVEYVHACKEWTGSHIERCL